MVFVQRRNDWIGGAGAAEGYTHPFSEHIVIGRGGYYIVLETRQPGSR